MREGKYVQKNKGITLISLIITIILLLILLGTSLGIVLRGDFFGKARKTSNTTIGKINEQDEKISDEDREWNDMEISLCSHIWGEDKIILEPTCTTPGKKERKCENCGKTVEIEASPLGHNYVNRVCTRCGDVIPLQPGDRATENEEYNGATIPKGFTISKIPGETTVDEGLVIYDIPEGTTPDWTNPDSVRTKYNQFVWIPVEVTSRDTATSIAAFTRSEWSNNERVKGLSSNYTEPDSNSDSANKTGIATQIEKLTKSIYKYRGFYVGRYEAGSDEERTSASSQKAKFVVQQDKYPYIYVSWGKGMSDVSEGAVYLCNNLYNETNTNYGATSMLCTGAEWDCMLDFIKDDKHSVTKSTTWGNYTDSETFEVSRGKRAPIKLDDKTFKIGNFYDIKGTMTLPQSIVILSTGATERNSSKNIFDVAGNCYEWTTESYTLVFRVGRGRLYKTTVDFMDLLVTDNMNYHLILAQ